MPVDAHQRNPYETLLNLPKPKCCGTGDCCKGVSPSKPFYTLWQKAAQGDEFARNFFSIMQPYASHNEAKIASPEVVERTLASAKKLASFPNDSNDVVFYKCRYLQADNRCSVHEDRPQFCRDYPDTPFIVMAPNCAYVPWAKACKGRYAKLKEDTEQAKQLKEALQAAQRGEAALPEVASQGKTQLTEEDWANWPWVFSLTSLFLASPPMDWWLSPSSMDFSRKS